MLGDSAGTSEVKSMNAMAARLVIALAWLFAAASAHATIFPAEGGKGARGEIVTCPDGYLLTGFHGGTGAWIDSIGLVCTEFRPPRYSAGDVQRLTPRGGPGGGLTEQYCDAEGAIREIKIEVLFDGAIRKTPKLVWVVEFSCTRPKDGSEAGNARKYTGIRQVPGFATDYRIYTHSCPGDEYATGVTVRYGKDVNALGLICGPAAASPPLGVGDAGRAGNTGTAERIDPTMENNTDRPGSDYDRFHINDQRPDRCQSECLLQRDRCKAWTYVRPGIQHQQAVCYLKNAVPLARSNTCCVSGVLPSKSRSAITQDPGGFAPGPLVPTPPKPGDVATEPDGGFARVPSSAGCKPPFVQRRARASDAVCVTRESFLTVQDENATAPSRWDPNGAYGPQTCIAGFVWREAFDGDTVCVIPARRAEVKEENRLAPTRREWVPQRPF